MDGMSLEIFHEGDIVKAVNKVIVLGTNYYSLVPFLGVVKASTDREITIRFLRQWGREEETTAFELKDGKYVIGDRNPRLERCRVLKVGSQVTSTITGEKMLSVVLSVTEPGIILLREDGELRTEESETKMFFKSGGLPLYNLPELEPRPATQLEPRPAATHDPWRTPPPPLIKNYGEAITVVCEELGIDAGVATEREKAQAFCTALNTDALLRQKIARATDAWIWAQPPPPPGTCFYRKLVYVLQKAQALVAPESERRSHGGD